MAKKISKSKQPEFEAIFRKLFWEARTAHAKMAGRAIAGSSAHKAVIAFSTARGWNWAKTLVEASQLDFMGSVEKSIDLLQQIDSAVPKHWQSLLNFVRGSALFANKNYDGSIKAYRKALEDPKFDEPGRAWLNLGLALHFRGKYDEAIKAYRNALIDPKFEGIGDAWNDIGVAFYAAGNHDEAINAFRKALDEPKYEMIGKTWTNIGIALGNKGKQDEAMIAFRKALEDPKYETPGNAWYNLGVSFRAQGKEDEAIDAYRKALDDPRLDTPGNAWNNLGNGLRAKGENQQAIKAYRKALKDPTYKTHAKAWTNLAETYIDLGKRKEAKEALVKALACSDPSGGDHARARLGLEVLKSKIETKALSSDDRALIGKPASGATTEQIEDDIVAAIREAGDTQYEKYLKDRDDSNRDNTLSILRGWSSAVTLLEGSERRWRGGGYFLKWRGHGVVIDPGFDFLRNFHDAGYHGREISAVIVSHNHPDHNSDLKDIDDLRYELYKRLATSGTSGSEPYILIWDQDTDKATKFGFESPEHQHEPVVMGSGFPQPIDLSGHKAKIPVRVTPFKVKHGSDVPHAMGLVLELLDSKGRTVFRIGYTADSGYFPNMHQHLTGCDILIAHISQPGVDELQDASAALKTVHLGYRGTAKLLGECKPKLALIGEFWAGFADLRIPLVKGLRQRSGVEQVLPAGLSMHIRLPSLEVECTECHKPTLFTQVKVAPPTDHFGSLAYLCQKCMI